MSIIATLCNNEMLWKPMRTGLGICNWADDSNKQTCTFVWCAWTGYRLTVKNFNRMLGCGKSLEEFVQRRECSRSSIAVPDDDWAVLVKLIELLNGRTLQSGYEETWVSRALMKLCRYILQCWQCQCWQCRDPYVSLRVVYFVVILLDESLSSSSWNANNRLLLLLAE